MQLPLNTHSANIIDSNRPFLSHRLEHLPPKLEQQLEQQAANKIAKLQPYTPPIARKSRYIDDKHPVLRSSSQATVKLEQQHLSRRSTTQTPQITVKETGIRKRALLLSTIGLCSAFLTQAPATALCSNPPSLDAFHGGELPLLRDALLSVGSGLGASAWVNLWGNLSEQGKVDSKTSRKIIHMTSAPLFLALWPLFSNTSSARLIAAAVPLLQIAKLIVASRNDNSAMAAAMSRSKQGSELLKGPALYAGILALSSLAWRNSFAATCALIQMAVGDGIADLAGRHLSPKDGSGKIPWNQDKSVIGTASFVCAATVATCAMIAWFNTKGFLLTPQPVMPKAALLSLACGLIETLPAEKIKIDDNLSVPLIAAVLGQILFQ